MQAAILDQKRLSPRASDGHQGDEGNGKGWSKVWLELSARSIGQRLSTDRRSTAHVAFTQMVRSVDCNRGFPLVNDHIARGLLMPLDECESVKAETLLRLLRHARSDMAAAAQRNNSVVGP